MRGGVLTLKMKSWCLNFCTFCVLMCSVNQKSHFKLGTYIISDPFPGGGTQIWKWRTSAYRRTKIGGIRCKISSKKGGHSVWAPKKWGLFCCGLPKMGVILCAKMQVQGKICKFSVKIATKSLNFSKCARSAKKNCNFHVKFDTKVEKRGSLGVDWIKKGSHWV